MKLYYKRGKYVLFLLIIVSVTTLGTLDSYQPMYNVGVNDSLTPFPDDLHDPILIEGTSGLLAFSGNEGVQGNGSKSNPFIIENYEIHSDFNTSIKIINTFPHIIIQNCRLIQKNLNIDSNSPLFYGIYLYNSSNIRIQNIDIDGFRTSISINHGENLTLLANNFLNTYSAALSIFNANSISIQSNTILNCSTGIEIFYSEYSSITTNYIYSWQYGLDLGNVDHTTISGNHIESKYGCSIELERSNHNLINKNNIIAKGLKIPINTIDSCNNSVTNNYFRGGQIEIADCNVMIGNYMYSYVIISGFFYFVMGSLLITALNFIIKRIIR